VPDVEWSPSDGLFAFVCKCMTTKTRHVFIQFIYPSNQNVFSPLVRIYPFIQSVLESIYRISDSDDINEAVLKTDSSNCKGIHLKVLCWLHFVGD